MVLPPPFHRIPGGTARLFSLLILAYGRLCGRVAIGFRLCTRPCPLHFEQQLRCTFFIVCVERESTLKLEQEMGSCCVAVRRIAGQDVSL